MKVAQKIEKRLLFQQEGISFGYIDLDIKPVEFTSAAKAVERLLKKGVISRIAPGLFYKPQKTIFGVLAPGESDLIKPYLFQNGRRIGYITGTRLYNQLALTTQVPKNLKIACYNRRIYTTVAGIEISSVKSYVEVTDENYYLLELLDIMKDFKEIPDTDPENIVKFLLGKISVLSSSERKGLIIIALCYPPRVRALAGALLSELKDSKDVNRLKKSLNPLSEYFYGIKKEYLSTATNWNIK